MHGRCQFARPIGWVLGIAMICGLVPGPWSTCARAQTRDGFDESVNFRVFNATTKGPGAVERLTIDYMTFRLNRILDTRPSGSTFTLEGVPLRDSGHYIVTAWWRAVPYWFEYRGGQMVSDTLTVNVFDTTEDLQGATLTGLNLVAHRRGELLELEYLLQLNNATSPQRTVLAGDRTLELAVPAGASNPEATYTRGPEPTPIAVTARGDRLLLAAPLTWGKNTIRVTVQLPWAENLELPVGLNFPLESWSLLLSPDWLEAAAPGLDPAQAADFPGFARYLGPPVEAGRTLSVRLTGAAAQTGPEGNLFAAGEDSAASEATTTTADDFASSGSGTGGLVRLVLVLALAALILLFVASRRSKSK